MCRLHREEINVFEAAANGAAIASKTVAAVLGCYIAFLSMLAFINATLSWLGGRVGYEELSFDVSSVSSNFNINLFLSNLLTTCSYTHMGRQRMSTKPMSYITYTLFI